MQTIRRVTRFIAAMAMACAVGNLPGCATMGGGMKYTWLPDTSSIAGDIVSL